MNFQCRVCLEFSKNSTFLYYNTDGTTLAEIIQFCAYIQIAENDGLPSHACAQCCEDAKHAFTFVKKCRQSDNELRAKTSIQKYIKNSPESVTESITEGRTQELEVDFLIDPTEIETHQRPIETAKEYVDSECEPNASLEETPDNDDYQAVEYLIEEVSVASGSVEQEYEVQEALQSKECSASRIFCCHGDCLFSFDAKDELKNHIFIQHPIELDDAPNKPFHCHQCDRSFATAEEQNLHGLLLQLKQNMFNASNKGRPKTLPYLFTAEEKKCCDCRAAFPTIEALLRHVIQQHSIRKTIHDPTRHVRCELCFKLFRSRASLYTHQSAPYKLHQYNCNTCGSCFLTPSRLAAHQIGHSTERRYVCENCGASFKKEQNLKTHLLHHGEKREVCNTCGLRFHRKSNLRMHERIHANAYHTQCPQCGKKYRNQSKLKEHMKVHTREKPLECRYCEKWFMYTSDRKRHEMTHTGEYPFVCECTKKFSRSRLYMRHVDKCKAEKDAMQ